MRSIKTKYEVCGVIMRWTVGKDRLFSIFRLKRLLLDLNFLYEFRRLTTESKAILMYLAQGVLDLTNMAKLV